jgi:hypothetical protein
MIFEDFSQSHGEGFDRVGGVDGFTNLRWKGKERNDPLPVFIQDLLMVGYGLSHVSVNSTKRCSASVSVLAV